MLRDTEHLRHAGLLFVGAWGCVHVRHFFLKAFRRKFSVSAKTQKLSVSETLYGAEH